MDIKQLTKKCSKCGKIKPLSEFYKDKRAKNGRQSWCKECIIKYEEKNKERILDYAKGYRENNKEYIEKYREENKEKIAKQTKKYQRNNKKKIRKRRHEYYIKNSEKESRRAREYYKSNRYIMDEYHNNYKKAKLWHICLICKATYEKI